MKIDSLRADEQAPHLPMPVQAQDHLEPAFRCAECARGVPKVLCTACAAVEAGYEKMHKIFTGGQ